MGGQQILTEVAYEENGLSAVNTMPSPVAIREAGAKGRGVFALRKLKKGEIAIVGKPVSRLSERTWLSVQVDVDTHVRMNEPFEAVNHSCDPNCGVKTNRYNGYNLVAMRDIEEGEEITFDYCMTEWIVSAFKECHCGSADCRKLIKGGRYVAPEVMQKYEGFTAPYYQSFSRELERERTS